MRFNNYLQSDDNLNHSREELLVITKQGLHAADDFPRGVMVRPILTGAEKVLFAAPFFMGSSGLKPWRQTG